MPIIVFTCRSSHVTKKFFRNVKDVTTTLPCESCGEDAKKTLSSPSSASKIVIDNGVQARAVEITPNIVEINEERSNKNLRED